MTRKMRNANLPKHRDWRGNQRRHSRADQYRSILGNGGRSAETADLGKMLSCAILYITMGLFSFSPKGRLGIDIGTSSIKIVELVKESNRFKLSNYGAFELDPGEDKMVSKLSNADIIGGIKQILSTTGMTARDAVASVPSFQTFSTTITMPQLSERELAKAIPFEARKYIPVPLTEVQLDWAVVNEKDVFLVAVPKEEVNRYREIMKGAGLDLRALELENFALIRSIVGNDLSPICILNVGGRSTSILIVENGFQRASHDYEIGGYEITSAIARSLGVNIKRAEEMKKSLGMRNISDNIIKEAVVSLINSMILEVNKTIQNYEDVKKSKIVKIFLVGGLANMPDILLYFSEKLGRTVSFGNPIARVVMPAGIDPLRLSLNLSFAVSIGLAMREI